LTQYGSFFNGMGDHHQRDLLFAAELEGKVLQIFTDHSIKRRKRLVHQQQIRMEGKSPCDGCSLTLTSGDLRRIMLLDPVNLKAFDPFIHNPGIDA